MYSRSKASCHKQSAKFALTAGAVDILTPDLLPSTDTRLATPTEIRTVAVCVAQINPALHLLPQGDPLNAIVSERLTEQTAIGDFHQPGILHSKVFDASRNCVVMLNVRLAQNVADQ